MSHVLCEDLSFANEFWYLRGAGLYTGFEGARVSLRVVSDVPVLFHDSHASMTSWSVQFSVVADGHVRARKNLKNAGKDDV